jgi:hypothetical protein
VNHVGDLHALVNHAVKKSRSSERGKLRRACTESRALTAGMGSPADEDTPFSRDPDETSRRPPIVARNGLGDLAQILSRLRSEAEFHSSG